jgi:hypothetical protein
MTEWNTDISPITKVKTIIYSKYRILIDRIYFGENKADVRIIVCNEDETENKEFNYTLTSIEYLQWISDSSLREIIKQKLRNEIF